MGSVVSFLLSVYREKFFLYILSFELRTPNDNTISQMDDRWLKGYKFSNEETFRAVLY